MADEVVGRAFYDLNAPSTELDRDLRAAETKVRRSGDDSAKHYESAWARGSGRVKEHIGSINRALAAVGIGIGLATVVTFFGGAINAASDLNEEASKSTVVFGRSADAVQAFARNADRALGQSERQALAAAGGFGNMFRTIGFTEDAAAGMSIRMVELASDMASFNNQDPSDMLDRLRSGLSGEAEPLRQFGVLISEARVKAFAYENGIAALGAELTEAQKIQARYGVILQDTTLQQGDFARTSTGLANTQRQNAAIMENSFARIGKAVLPLAQEMANLAGDVMPHLADAIIDVVEAAVPLVRMLGALAGLWLEHADKLIPLLAVALAVRLVSGLSAAEVKTKALTLAMNSLRGALLLGLPFVFEMTKALANWTRELEHGADAIPRIERLQDAINDLGAGEKMYTRLSAVATQYNADLDEIIEHYARLVEAGAGPEEALERVTSSLERAAERSGVASGRIQASFETMPEGVRRALTDTTAAIGDADIGDTFAEPFEEGRDRAIQAVSDTYAGIAAEIAARENALKQAGGDAVKAWFDPLVWANQAGLVQEQLVTANAELLAAQQAGTAAEIAEAKKRVLELTQQAIELQMNLATTGSDMEQAANLSALATSDFMDAGLHSKDPEIRALFRVWYESLRDAAADMEGSADDDSRRISRLMWEGLNERDAAIRGTVRGWGETRPDTSWAYGSGSRIGADFLAGLSSYWTAIRNASVALGEAAATGIRIRSPAKAGPFTEDPATWSMRALDRWLGPFRRGIPIAAAVSRDFAAAAASGLMGGPGPGLVPAASAGSAGNGPGHITHQHFYLRFNGEERVVDTPFAAVEEAQRMGVFEGA